MKMLRSLALLLGLGASLTSLPSWAVVPDHYELWLAPLAEVGGSTKIYVQACQDASCSSPAGGITPSVNLAVSDASLANFGGSATTSVSLPLSSTTTYTTLNISPNAQGKTVRLSITGASVAATNGFKCKVNAYGPSGMRNNTTACDIQLGYHLDGNTLTSGTRICSSGISQPCPVGGNGLNNDMGNSLTSVHGSGYKIVATGFRNTGGLPQIRVAQNPAGLGVYGPAPQPNPGEKRLDSSILGNYEFLHLDFKDANNNPAALTFKGIRLTNFMNFGTANLFRIKLSDGTTFNLSSPDLNPRWTHNGLFDNSYAPTDDMLYYLNGGTSGFPDLSGKSITWIEIYAIQNGVIGSAANFFGLYGVTLTPADHIMIAHDGAATAGSSETITLKACANAGAGCAAPSNAHTVTLTTTAGTFASSGSNTVTVTIPPTGTTSVVLQNASGDATFSISSAAPYPVDNYYCSDDNGATSALAPSSKCTLNFAGIHHIELSHDGSGSACAAESITLKACQDASCSTLATTAVTVDIASDGGSLSSSSLSFTGLVNTLKLTENTARTNRLSITGSNPATLSNWTCSNTSSGASNQTTACDINFSGTGVLIFSTPTSITAGKTNHDFSVTAIGPDPLAPDTCKPAFQGNKTLTFWYGYDSPASGSLAPSINSTSIGDSGNKTSLSLNFDAAGTASFALDYRDAGRLQLNAAFDDGLLSMSGSTQIISLPAGLCATASPAPTPAGCSTGGNSSSLLCNSYRAAGDSFDIAVKAVVWQSDADTNLCDNDVTANFSANNIQLSPLHRAPAGGVTGSLSLNSLSLSNGTGTLAGTRYSEAGEIQLQVDAFNYLGIAVPASQSGRVGKFYPKRFTINTHNSPTLYNGPDASWTAPFTYRGQGFRYKQPLEIEVTAVASDGSTTRNYDDDALWRLNAAALTPNYASTQPGVSLGTPSGSRSNSLLADDTPGDGMRIIRLDDAADLRLIYSRNTLPFDNTDAPFTANFVARLDAAALTTDEGTCLDSEQDGNCDDFSQTISDGSVEIRFGRAHLHSGGAPETSPLTLALELEYWTGLYWAANTLDVLTPLASLHLATSQFTGGLQDGEISSMSVGPALPVAGRGEVSLSAPGEGNGGSVTITIDNIADWLKLDQDNDGQADDAPSAEAIFGTPSESRVIFMHEQFGH